MAMRLLRGGRLVREEVEIPVPGPGQLLLKVLACGVCRTDLHLLDGELPDIAYPVTPGHEVVGCVAASGQGASRFKLGDRVGVPWLGRACGACRFCLAGLENLCDFAEFTGYTIDGGYARYMIADERFCLSLPASYSDTDAAPLLCAGLIGYRAYRAAGEGQSVGLYGFGAAAHILAQVAIAQGRRVYAFTRPGDDKTQAFARELGVEWVGGSDTLPPALLDAAILFAPVGDLIPAALNAVRKGGRVICAGIHMTDIPAFPYRLLWGERSLSSVANLTRADGEEFMNIAANLELRPTVEVFELARANDALAKLRSGQLEGAAVLTLEGLDHANH